MLNGGGSRFCSKVNRKYREGSYRQGAKWLGNSRREDDINEGITYLRALQNEMQIVYCTIINQGNRRRMVDIIEVNVLDVELLKTICRLGVEKRKQKQNG